MSSNERVIPTSKGKNLASENNMLFFETSAKSGRRIKDLFVTIAHKVYEQMKN